MKEFIASLYHFLISIIMWLPFSFLRKWTLRLFGLKIGKHSQIMRNVDVRCPYRIIIGSGTTIEKNVLLDGRGGQLKIGDNVDIAQGSSIWTLEHDYNAPDFHSVGDSVEISDYCWIASNATILPGVKLGRGAVVATSAVVTKDVPDLTVVAGIPAKAISSRKDNMKYHLGDHVWFR